jgi:hypothetical protein
VTPEEIDKIYGILMAYRYPGSFHKPTWWEVDKALNKLQWEADRLRKERKEPTE